MEREIELRDIFMSHTSKYAPNMKEEIWGGTYLSRWKGTRRRILSIFHIVVHCEREGGNKQRGGWSRERALNKGRYFVEGTCEMEIFESDCPNPIQMVFKNKAKC